MDREAEYGDTRGEGTGEIKVAMVLEIDSRLSLTCLISTGAPRSHTSHQWRSVLFSRVLVPQLSQTKNSFFMTNQFVRDAVGQLRISFSTSGAEFEEPSIAIWLR